MLSRGSALLAALLLVAAQAAPDEKALEEAAKTKIDEFNKAKGKFKTDNDTILGLASLGSVVHPRVQGVLSGYLRTGSDNVKRAVAGLLAAYKNDKTVAEELSGLVAVEAGKAKRDKTTGGDMGHETAVAMIDAIGLIGHKHSAIKLTAYFQHANLQIVKASVKACGDIKSVEPVDQLISLLMQVEQGAAAAQRAPAAPAQPVQPKALPPGSKMPSTPNTPFGNNVPGAQPATQGDYTRQDALRKKGELEPVIQTALHNITGDPAQHNGADWSIWWNKNKNALKKKEQEELKAEKAAGK